MVSCGKRGSLPVAGWANMVAANQPPAAASVSDESQTDVECIIASVVIGASLIRRARAGPVALEPNDPRGHTTRAELNRADIAQTGLRQHDALGMRRGSLQSMLSANTVRALP